jgi:hypothetical protein
MDGMIMIDKIRSFASLKEGWDSYDAPAISQICIDKSIECYERFSIKPDVVTPSVVGAIAFYWKELHVFLEIYNDGEMCIVTDKDKAVDDMTIKVVDLETAYNMVGQELVKRLPNLSDNYKRKVIGDLQKFLGIKELLTR